jgi:UDP-2-acetamido-2-deoxy-ribo-hexuluronate aminotransferase
VLADVCADTFNLDPDSVARRITPKTAAVIPVHLFGHCADMARLMPLTREKELAVIEDNAQSLGATCCVTGQTPVYGGTIGMLGTTSFFPTKMLGGMGDGGAVFTNDARLARRIAQTARHGQEQKYSYGWVGLNSRLDSLQAAVLTVKLRYLEQHILARRQVAGWYTQVLQEEKQVSLPGTQPGHTHVYNQYTIRVAPNKRDVLRQFLASSNIPTGLYYQTPLHLQPAYRYLGYLPGDLPQAELLCRSVISLPMHPFITQEQVAYIGEKIKHFFK